jgi:3-methyladenine DNA glycosylase Mpg
MQIAEYVLNGVNLVVGTSRCRIVEVEYYADPDPYIHGTPEQATAYRWYFHKSGTSFRGGTFKGLDLTFGNVIAEHVHHGGVLIRSIRTPSGALIEGPCKVVDFILNHTGAGTIVQLVALCGSYPPSATQTSSILYLEETSITHLPIFQGPRVGLSVSHPQYLMKPLRFTTVPTELKKGRALLILHNYLLEPHLDWKIHPGHIIRWMTSFRTESATISLNSVNDMCQAYGYCYRRGWCV